mmetsp:Transcript_20099/g.33858  ORF Transcript_20099/g.33858 Transcript_20099/m.33858 type:complete len:100 (-) Transcript_20099:220-519(-)
MVRVFFPDMYMRLMGVNLKSSVGRATFYVKPSMTKHEVKEYLTKIYGMEVYKVETANFLGRWKRFYGKKKIISYKRRNFKKAYVSFLNSNIQDSDSSTM